MQIFVLDIVDVSKFTFWEYLCFVSSFKCNATHRVQTFTEQRCRLQMWLGSSLRLLCFFFLFLFSLCIGTTLNNATCWSEVSYGILLWHCSTIPYVFACAAVLFPTLFHFVCVSMYFTDEIIVCISSRKLHRLLFTLVSIQFFTFDV